MAFNNIPPNGFPQIPDIEDLEAVVKDVATLKAAKAAKTDIAPEFSATNNYAVGDMVYHEGTLYVCSTAHAAAAWDAQDFTAASVASEVSGLVSDVSDLNGTKANQITIAPFFNPEASYEVGDLVYYNGLSYRCTNDHEGAWDADDFAATTIAGELSRLNSNITDLLKSKYSGRALRYFGVAFTGNKFLLFLPSGLPDPQSITSVDNVVAVGVGGLNVEDTEVSAGNGVIVEVTQTNLTVGAPIRCTATIVWA